MAEHTREGGYVDAVDSSQKWLVAFVKQLDPAKGALVRFDGWSNKWNEWLSLKSHRLAPFRRHTSLYTGQVSNAIRDWAYEASDMRSLLARLKEGVQTDAYEITQFYRGHLFMYVDNLLATAISEENLEEVLAFLNAVQDFALNWIQTLPTRFSAIYQGLASPEAFLTDKDVAYAFIWPELFYTLERLFGCEQRLQELLSAQIPDSVQLETLEPLSVPFRLQHHFIAYFIKKEGFQRLGNIAQLEELPLQLIPDFPVWLIFPYIKNEFVEEYRKLTETILDRLERFSEKDQRNYDKSCLHRLFFQLNMVATALHSDSLFRRIETAELAISLELLRSKFLDKRVRGINNLSEAVNRTSAAVADRFRYYSSDPMLEWLRTNTVLRTILTDRPHIEVLKRSQGVFAFLAEHGQITGEDLEALWNSMADKHESYVRTIYELLGSVASWLSRDLLELVYQKLQTLDITASPDFVIEGMKQFTLSACRSLWKQNQPFESFCLREFLSALQTAPDSPKAEQLSTCVAELLKVELFRSFRQQILENLRKAGPQAATLIVRLLNDFSEDFIRTYLYTNGTALQKDAMKWITEATYSQAKGLRVLLDLLTLVASKGSYSNKLKEEDLQRLWRAIGGRQAEETEVFFSWLQGALVQKAEFLVGDSLAVKVFEGLMCHLTDEAVEQLGSAAFACFQQFFLFANQQSHRLQYREDYVVCRLADDLIGLDTLLAFALRSVEENVRKLAIRLLAQLHTRIPRNADSGILEHFVGGRLEELKMLAQAENTDLQIDRNLRIVTGIAEAFEYIKTPRVAKISYVDWQTVYYHLSSDNSWKSLALSRNDTLGTLRRSVAATSKLPADCVKLEAGQVQYTFLDDEILLGKLTHALHFIVRIEQHDYQLQDFAELVGHNEDAQDLLFHLISRGDRSYRDRVWLLLSRLPSNQLIQLKTKELGVTFKAMAHSPSFHKQLFALMVLSSLNKAQPAFREVFKGHCPNELFRILKSNAGSGSLMDYLESYDSALVLQYAQLMLQLCHAYRTRAECPLSKAQVVLYVLELLFVYASKVQETSEMPNPPIPTAAWQTILEYVGQEDFEELRGLLLTFPHFDQLIFHSLQRAKNAWFSHNMKEFFLKASQQPLNLQAVLSDKLISVIPAAVDSTDTTNAYFSLTSRLIKQGDTDVTAAFAVLFDFLKGRASEAHPKAEDKGMTGALKLMRAMAKRTPALASREIAEFLLLTCLIDFQETHESQSGKPKCKSEGSRLAAFKLLGVLAGETEVRTYVLEVLGTFQRDTSWRKPKFLCWANSANIFEKSATGFVGLRNHGCTCYMNSMLQQLFMIPSFRQGLFQAQASELDSVLYQLQKILAGLEKSDKMFVQTKGLCSAYTNWEGQPLNPNEQMDGDEFFNGLLDKAEEGLKPTAKSKLIEEHFRGILTTQCIGKGSCSHRSERDEPFLTLPIEIKNKKSIYDSLDALVTGETLEGDNAYACDFCAAKVTARRRLCIRSLPNFLVLTLRRFDFDMDTMNRVKLNNYCDFPLLLNMEPYTLEAVMRKDAQSAQEDKEAESPASEEIPADYFQYQLRGVVIHMGLAEAGHYYSYILDKASGKWIEFNDANVEEFNPDNLPKEAFGSAEKLLSEENGKQRNAYIVLYERTQKYQLKSKDDILPSLLPPVSPLPPASSAQQLLDKVHISNQRYWRKRRVFSPEYSRFILTLTERTDLDTLKFILGHYLTVQIRSKEPATLLLKHVFEKATANEDLAQWLLQTLSFEPLVRELFFDNPLLEGKKFLVAIADRCLRNVNSTLQTRFLVRLLTILPKVPEKITVQHAGFFELLYRTALLAPEAAAQLDLPRRLLNLVFGLPQPELEPAEPSTLEVGLGRQGEELVAKFAPAVGTQTLSYSYQLAVVNQALDYLSPDLVVLLKDKAKIALLVKGAHGRFGANQMSKLYRRLIRSDSSLFTEYFQALCYEVRNNDYDQHKSPLIQLKRLISGNDHANEILREITQILNTNLQYIRATESLVNFLYRLVARFPAVRTWINSNLNQLTNLNSWKQKYQLWSNQSTSGLYLTKVYSPHSQFMEFHPSGLLCTRLQQLVSAKVPETTHDFDSDDDLYEEPLAPKMMLDFAMKEDVPYRVEVMETFTTLHLFRYEGMDPAPFFLGADDDRLMKVSIKPKLSVGLK